MSSIETGTGQGSKKGVMPSRKLDSRPLSGSVFGEGSKFVEKAQRESEGDCYKNNSDTLRKLD